MKESPKVYLSLESKKLIVEALVNHINRWGIKVDNEPLSEDAKIELNRIALDVNKYYKQKTGYKKYKYPLIPKKKGEINGRSDK